jgi:O-succinylbenzoic acid--CoA ligase
MIQKEQMLAWMERNGMDRATVCFRECLEALDRERQRRQAPVLRVVLRFEDPESWVGAAFAMMAEGQSLWFASPRWGDLEWQQCLSIAGPQLVFADGGADVLSFSGSAAEEREGTIAAKVWIPTGGSSGMLRFAGHDWRSFGAAIEGMSRFFLGRQAQQGDFAYRCALPLWHVSGWMQCLRSCWTASEWWHAADGGSYWERPRFQGPRSWISLVPAQLSKILDAGGAKALRQWNHLVLGGAACPDVLMMRALEAGLRPWVTYGMTETAGMIAAVQPDGPGWQQEGARVFPHAELRLGAVEGAGDGIGRICLRSDSLCCGYNGRLWSDQELSGSWWDSGDLGRMPAHGRIDVCGRVGRMINTGGEKVSPEEVEQLLLRHDLLRDVLVFSEPDARWGQRVCCAYSTVGDQVLDEEALRAWLGFRVSPYKIPKTWIFLPDLPRDEKGKCSESRLRAFLRARSENA